MFFWRELIERHPAAKVVLTIRDPGRWYASTHRTGYRLNEALRAGSRGLEASNALPAEAASHLSNLRFLDTFLWKGVFDDRFEDREHAIRVFEEHNAAVEAGVPPERLLVYEVKEGWAPLCRFLGVDAPANEPFPHLNDTGALRQRLTRFYR